MIITIKSNPFGHLCEQHVDETAHLWGLWVVAIDQPMYDKKSLGDLERRIYSNISGMMLQSDDSWIYCEELFDAAFPGEIFAAAQIAFRSYKSNRIRTIINLVADEDLLAQGFVSALVWLPKDIAHPWLKKFLESKDLNHKALALEACRLRNENPGQYLTRFLEREDCRSYEPLYIQCLRVAGDLKRTDVRELVRNGLKGSEDVKFWASYGLILLGEHELAEQLTPYIFHEGIHQKRAIELAFRVLPNSVARQLISDLSDDTKYARSVVQATAVLADPHAIPWLLGQMKDPSLARLCGEAFFEITGLDLEKLDLTVDDPYTAAQKADIESEQSDANMSEDEHLPWPDTAKIWAHWHNYSKVHFNSGMRYFLGGDVSAENLNRVLANGRQRQRHGAALYLALMLPECLHNTYGVINPEQ